MEAHVLDFRGKAKVPSEHNFILMRHDKDTKKDEEVMLLGKVNDNEFNMEIRWPLSVLQGFSIAIASFAFKLFGS